MNSKQRQPTAQSPTSSRRRRSLLALASLILLVVGIYIEEDWRGYRAWEHYKETLRAKGEIVDWNAYIPSPVPDEQNVMKASHMEEWFSMTGYRNWLFPTTNELARSLENPRSSEDLTDQTAAAAYLAWSDQFEPEFDTMRAAFARPSVQFAGDYRQPSTMPVLNLPSLRMVVFTLTQRAQCELLLGQPEKAWRDLALLLDFGRLVPDKPTGKPMILHTYAIWAKRSIVIRAADIIRRGLETEAWTEPQLATLEDQLKGIDFIGLEAEVWKSVRTLETTTSREFVRQIGAAEDAPTNFWQRAKEPQNLLFWIGPRGWTYLWIIHLGNRFQKASEVLGGIHGVASPTQLEKIPGRLPGRDAMPLLFYNQVVVDETRVACALGRCHLSHHEYPESLDALAPQFIEKAPHDLIGGRPLKYRRTNDEKFLLYSVGWNETDDGGVSLSGFDHPQNLKRGDWVWDKARH